MSIFGAYPKELKELYTYLGLKDKNENKVVEKKVKGEKYQAKMDLDGNGKIVKVEAQYHLIRLNIEDMSKEKKEKFPAMQKKFALTAKDKKKLVKIFTKRIEKEREIKDPALKTSAMMETLFLILGSNFTKEQRKELVKESLKTADSVEDNACRTAALLIVFGAMRPAGFSDKEIEKIKEDLEAGKE